MKTLALTLIIAIFFSSICIAEEIMLQWDIPDAGQDGYYIYQTVPYQDENGTWKSSFDYDAPVTTDAYPNGKIPAHIDSLVLDLPGRKGRVTKYIFVARSFSGTLMSENSNEVDYKVVLVPPETPMNLSGHYDADEEMVTLKWEQPLDEYEIEKWVVYYRLTEDDDFIELGTVRGGQLSLSAEFDAVPPGDVRDVTFVVVAHRRSGVYSPNSEEFSLTIDRRQLVPPENLRISIEIQLK